MYTDALKHYKSGKDVDGYMNALRNAEDKNGDCS